MEQPQVVESAYDPPTHVLRVKWDDGSSTAYHVPANRVRRFTSSADPGDYARRVLRRFQLS